MHEIPAKSEVYHKLFPIIYKANPLVGCGLLIVAIVETAKIITLTREPFIRDRREWRMAGW